MADVKHTKLIITIDSEDDALTGTPQEVLFELSRIVRVKANQLAGQAEIGSLPPNWTHWLRDRNGNKVGSFTLTFDLEEYD